MNRRTFLALPAVLAGLALPERLVPASRRASRPAAGAPRPASARGPARRGAPRRKLTFSTIRELQDALDVDAPRDIYPDESLEGRTLVGTVEATVPNFRLFGDGVSFAIDGRFRCFRTQDFLVQNLRCLGGQVPIACRDSKYGEFRNCTSGHGWSQSFSVLDDCKDILLHRCMAIYALSYGRHPEGEHSKGYFIVATLANDAGTYPDRIRLEECAAILCASRLPNAQGNQMAGNVGGRVDVNRCVMYGWGGPELEEMGPHFGLQYDRGCYGTVSRTLYLGNDHSTGPPVMLDNKRGEPIVFRRTYHLTRWPHGRPPWPSATDPEGGVVAAPLPLHVPPRGVSVVSRDERDALRLYRRLVIRSMPKWGCQPWASGEIDAYADLLTRSGVPGVPGHRRNRPRLFP